MQTVVLPPLLRCHDNAVERGSHVAHLLKESLPLQCKIQ